MSFSRRFHSYCYYSLFIIIITINTCTCTCSRSMVVSSYKSNLNWSVTFCRETGEKSLCGGLKTTHCDHCCWYEHNYAECYMYMYMYICLPTHLIIYYIYYRVPLYTLWFHNYCSSYYLFLLRHLFTDIILLLLLFLLTYWNGNIISSFQFGCGPVLVNVLFFSFPKLTSMKGLTILPYTTITITTTITTTTTITITKNK